MTSDLPPSEPVTAPRTRRTRRAAPPARSVVDREIANELRRLRIAIGTFLIVVVAGVVGYTTIEGVPVLDSLYMTIITITTVGFREIVEPSTAGKILTMGLIVAGFGSVSYAVVTAAEFVLDGTLRFAIERRRMSRTIDEMHNHVIVCGFGRVGRHLANQLDRDGAAFVVVDDDEVKIAELQGLDYLHIQGDATEERVLQEAGLERASAVVAAVHFDADNVLITLTSKGLNPTAVVVSRVKADENEAKLHRAGADRVIAPATIGGRRIAQILTRPAVADFLDRLGAGAVDYTLEEVPVRRNGGLAGRTLKEAGVRERFGCTVVAIRHARDSSLESHPAAESLLEENDVLVVMGNDEQVTAMRNAFR